MIHGHYDGIRAAMETPIGVDTAMEIEASFFRGILCVVIV